MKYITTLPVEYVDEANDPEMGFPVSVWQKEEPHEICELDNEECDKGRILFGTDDYEPKVCPFHFFQISAKGTFRPTIISG